MKHPIQKIADLQDDERNVLLGMIGRDMMEHPDNDRCFEITHAIIDAGYAEMIEIYKNTLQRLCENGKDSVIPASVAIGMKTLGEKDANFKAIIENVNKSTRLAKALGIQIKKQ